MAWDFSTEPEFEAKLDWMRTFVREEIWPLETVLGELDQTGLDRIYAPLQDQVKARGLWAAHLDPELGGQGFGQVKLGLMHEVLGTSPFAPNAFGCQAPDSGNSEILALAGTEEQKDRFLHPLLAGDLKGFGALLDASHDSLRQEMRCSSAGLDKVCAAMRRAGAYGARLTGAGFGGHAFAAAPPEQVTAIIEAAIAATGGPAFEVRASAAMETL